MKIAYHFLGWASTQLHFFTVAKAWKQIRVGNNSAKAGHFAFLMKRDFRQRPMREKEIKASRSLTGVYSRKCCPEGLWLERRQSLFAQITMIIVMMSGNIIKLLIWARHSASYLTHFILLFHSTFTSYNTDTFIPLYYFYRLQTSEDKEKQRNIT